jgi:hypothetical protein
MASPEPGPQPVSRLSRTPSWVMLGFILGAAFVALLPPWRPAPAAPPAAAAEASPAPAGALPDSAGPREPGPLLTIEAVFAAWQRLAVWSDDTTEVALWNARDRGFTDFYEVRRHGDALYFRSLPRLTRRIIERGQPAEAPLQFTETEEQYEQWRESSRRERSQGVPVRPPAAAAPAPAPVRVEVSPGEPIPPRIEVPPPGRTVVK